MTRKRSEPGSFQRDWKFTQEHPAGGFGPGKAADDTDFIDRHELVAIDDIEHDEDDADPEPEKAGNSDTDRPQSRTRINRLHAGA